MKYVMRAVAETLFWLGDKVSYLVPALPGLFYPVYNKLMVWSVQIQDKYDLDGPWEKAK